MAFVSLHLNGRELGTVGSRDVDIMTLTLVGNRSSGSFWLQIGGLEAVPMGSRKPANWFSGPICKDDRLRVDFVGSLGGQVSASRSSSEPLDSMRAEELSLDVEFSDSEQVLATFGDDDTLQLVATYKRGDREWKVEIDSVTVSDSGFTTGKSFTKKKLQSLDWIEIRCLAARVA